MPRRLEQLGLPAAELQRHIAWDIGAAALASRLSKRLDAVLVLQNYSRLVIDCNRPPGSAESIVTESDGTSVPGNQALPRPEAQVREQEIFRPYHARLEAELAHRKTLHRRAVLVAVHTFTPVFDGQARPWHAGLLYNRDRRLADILLPALRAHPGLVIGDREPYSVDDETDYTLPVHGEQRALPHVGIEIRQDLVTTAAGQDEWAERLARVLVLACAALELQ